MKRNKTVRTIVLDFVQANGPQDYSTLLDVVLTVSGQPLTNRHWGSGYLDQVSSGSVCNPTRNEKRYLQRDAYGLYNLVSE